MSAIAALLLIVTFVFSACVTTPPPKPEPPPPPRFSQANREAVHGLAGLMFFALEQAGAPEWFLEFEDGAGDRVLVALEKADFANDELSAFLAAFIHREMLETQSPEELAAYFKLVFESLIESDIPAGKMAGLGFHLLNGSTDILDKAVEKGALSKGDREIFDTVLAEGEEGFVEALYWIIMIIMGPSEVPDGEYDGKLPAAQDVMMEYPAVSMPHG